MRIMSDHLSAKMPDMIIIMMKATGNDDTETIWIMTDHTNYNKKISTQATMMMICNCNGDEQYLLLVKCMQKHHNFQFPDCLVITEIG